MESYFIKSSLSMVVLYALYHVMLRYELNHQLNRFIGLACLLFSMAVPFIQFEPVSSAGALPAVVATVTDTTAGLQDTVSAALPEHTVDVLFVLYVLGAGLCLLRCVVGLATLLKLYRSSLRQRRWGFTVVELGRHVSPFTFFNVLFMGEDRMSEPERQTMLQHEQVHREQYHSVDNIFLEVVAVIFWFNPVMWFFRRDIKAEHEYYADERVLADGIDAGDYQHMLFKARTGVAIGVGNYWSNKTSLIKRFHMMTKAGLKSKYSYWRASLYIALMTVIVSLSAFSQKLEGPRIAKMAVYAQGEEAMYKTFGEYVTYPASARRENRTGLVEVSFTVNEKGDVENIKAGSRKNAFLLKEVVVTGYARSSEAAKGVDEALRNAAIDAVKSFGKFNPAEEHGKPVSCEFTLPVKFRLE